MRLGRDAAAALERGAARMKENGADGDVEIHMAGEAQEADRTAINVARYLLDLGDDLLGSDLGRAGDRAARKAGGNEIAAALAARQPAGDHRRQMMHRGVGFEAAE